MASFVVGVLVGFMIGTLVFVSIMVLGFKYDGTVIIKYDSEGEGPYLFLECEDNPKKFEKKVYCIFKVKRQ